MDVASQSDVRVERGRVPRESMFEQFADQGYLDAIRVLSPAECQQFREAVAESAAPPRDWDKGHAVSSRAFYEIATHPVLIEVLTTLLGEDVLLWGACIVTRSPGEVHPWHSDIESSSAPPGKTVSVWIGVHHTSRDSSLLIIPYSHRFGNTVQEVRYRLAKKREGVTDDEILGWAQRQDTRSRIVRSELTDGEALVFDGQMWHGSRNTSGGTRQALLLQYCTPNVRIRIPDLKRLDWPFRYRKLKRPACIVVNGTSKTAVNRIVSAPVARTGQSSRRLASRVYQLRIPLAPDNEKGWKPYPLLEGQTAGLRYISCHASVLAEGHCPHPPHKHSEEELLLLLAGEVDVILPAQKRVAGSERRRLRPGQFVYYPANFAHTLETVGKAPANYMMFKWFTGNSRSASHLYFGQFDICDYFPDPSTDDGFRLRVLFEGPTEYLQRLHCHASTLMPGGGYEPHSDPYDVGIVVLEGEIETLGERAAPHSVIFCPAGERHGMRNTGDSVARYIVFEFHGSRKGLMDGGRSFFVKLRDPRRVKRKLKSIISRITRQK